MKRHLTGQDLDMADLMKGDVFNYSYKRGLSRCRECSIGKELARCVQMIEPGMAKS